MRGRFQHLLLLFLPLSLTGCISAGVGAIRYAEREADPLRQAVQAEREFALLAQTAGQWTAFRATAAPEALMFVPQPVNAQSWLAGRADPPRSVAWQPHRVYVSCDGRTAATTGAAQWPGGSHGMFTTIWQKQADGEWKWVADHGGPVATPLAPPDEVIQIRADCDATTSSEPPPLLSDQGDTTGGGASRDGSLRWAWVVRPNGALRFVVDVRQDGCITRVMDDGAGGA
jgi:hypothetical protein